MKVLHMLADQTGSGWYRMLLPALGLRWLGHETAVGYGVTPDWEDADVVIGARVSVPGASAKWRQLASRGVRLILDLDDDYWNLDPLNERAHATWTPQLLDSLARNMDIADRVTVCSNELARRMAQYTDTPIVVVPNSLPAQLMAPVRNYRPKKLRIGWVGTASTVHDLPVAARALRKIADRPDVEVVAVGVPNEQLHAAGVRHPKIGTYGWVDHTHYMDLVATFDIWVAPYRDTAFNRAKFPTKALESSMHGIPLLASAITPYEEWIEDGKTGMLVRQEHEWTRLLRQLVEDADLRESLGHAARARASENILQAMNFQWEAVCTP